MQAAPLVGISACSHSTDPLPCQRVGLKYIEAVAHAAAALPVMIPALDGGIDADALLDRLDGVFLTGSPSNVAPERYGAALAAPDILLDRARDETTFALIAAALARGIPLFAVCRGFQELNVALGGSLHQFVHQQPGLADHRARDADLLDVQYGPAHPVTLQAGGLLAALLPGRDRILVNSLHAQGIARLASGLRIEALAPDGLIEAVSVSASRSFALAVQWHPEWRVRDNPDALPLFRAFGEACRARLASRAAPDLTC